MSTTYSEPGIFNVLDPWIDIPGVGYTGLIAHKSDTATAQQNTVVLQGIIELALESCSQSGTYTYGATILFPGHTLVPPPIGGGTGTEYGATYYFAKANSATVTLEVYCNWPLRFLGTGNVTLALVGDQNGAYGDLFSLQTENTGLGPNTGGVTFEDLSMVCAQGATTTAGLCAIHTIPLSTDQGAGGATNVRIVRCVLSDWQIAVWFERVLDASILQCYVIFAVNSGTGVMLGNGLVSTDNASAKEVFISGCYFDAGGSPPGGITNGISVLGCDHLRVDSCEIDGFVYGILIKPGPHGDNAVHCSFSQVSIYAFDSDQGGGTGTMGSAVIIQPQAEIVAVGQIVFTSCFFEMSASSKPAAAGLGGVLVDATSGPVDTIRFVSCNSERWPCPGLIVKGGAANIEVLGGMYAGNNYDASWVSQAYGIYIGKASNVRIVGVSCIGQYEYITLANASPSEQQDVGLYIDQGASDIIVEGCDFTENATYGIQINGADGAITRALIRDCDIAGYGSYGAAVNVAGAVANVSTVYVTNCTGYNDWSPLLYSGAVGSSSFYNYTYGYFGPVSFYIGPSGGATIKIGGHTTGLTGGAFVLAPSQSGQITVLPPIPEFVIIGQ